MSAKKPWPTKDEIRERKRRARAVKLRLVKLAKARGLSFTAFIKKQLPGWPKYRGPRLTLARAEAIADRCERQAAAKLSASPTPEKHND